MSKELEDKERQQRDDIQWVLGTEQGRRFVWRLLSEARVFHDMEGDPNQIIKQVGRRQMGLFLISVILDADKDAWFQMQMEAANKITEEKIHGRRNPDARKPDTDADAFEQQYTNGSGSDELPSYESALDLSGFL